MKIKSSIVAAFFHASKHLYPPGANRAIWAEYGKYNPHFVFTRLGLSIKKDVELNPWIYK